MVRYCTALYCTGYVVLRYNNKHNVEKCMCGADNAAGASLQHYIAARQQNSIGTSNDAANTSYSNISSSAHQLHIQPLCLTGSLTSSSSPGIASSGNPSISASETPPPGNMGGAAAHAYFFMQGLRGLSGSGHFDAGQSGSAFRSLSDSGSDFISGQLGAGLRASSGSGSQHFDAGRSGTAPSAAQLAAAQAPISPEVAQLLAGAVAARATATATAADRLEPKRCLTEKENSACIAFDEMSMGRQEASSLAEAASSQPGSGSQHFAVSESSTAHGLTEPNMATPSVGSSKSRVAIHMKSGSDRLDADGCQGRSAARRMKLHAMMENL